MGGIQTKPSGVVNIGGSVSTGFFCALLPILLFENSFDLLWDIAGGRDVILLF